MEDIPYTIGEISKLFNVPASKIRYWEEREIFQPKRNSENDYRLFNLQATVELLDVIFYRNLNVPLKKMKHLNRLNPEAIYTILEDTEDKVQNDYLNTYLSAEWGAAVMNDVINAVMMWKGYPICDDNREHLKELRDILVKAKPSWASMNYGANDMLSRGDYQVALSWNGKTLGARLEDANIKYVYPDEGVVVGGDFLAILKDAKNVENAKLFMNFVMDPENAGLLSDFGKSATGIIGSEKFLPKEIADAPEIVMPETVKTAYGKTCSNEVNQIYSQIWTELMR